MMRASSILSLLFLSTSGRWPFALNLIFAQARPVSTAAPRDLAGKDSPPPQDTAREAALTSIIIISLLLFVLISGFLLSYVLFGSKIRGYLLPKPSPSKSNVSKIQRQPPLSSLVPYGLGYDGLTEAEVEAYYAKEEQENSPELRISSDSPPYLTLKHQSESGSPILPMQMEWDRQIIFQSPDIVNKSALASRRISVKISQEDTRTLKAPLIASNARESSPPPISSHHPSRALSVPGLSHSELIELPFCLSDRLDRDQ